MSNLYKPSQEEIMNIALDITAPNHSVQIEIREDGQVIWVNIDGVCALRVCRIPKLELNDSRKRILDTHVTHLSGGELR
jgi:hypothetical protein